MELTVSDEKMKDFMKEIMTEMIKERKDFFYEIILEAMEEVALADAIMEGRKDEFVNEDRILEVLEERVEVCFESSFERDLKKIRDRRLLKRVKETIYEVKKSGNLSEIRNLNKMKGYKTFYRIRIGDYRIGIDLVRNKIIFTRILHRKEIYKYFP